MDLDIKKHKKSCPCGDCLLEDRYRACHDTCEKYLEWKQKYESIKSECRKISIIEDYRKKEMFKNVKRSGKDIYEV